MAFHRDDRSLEKASWLLTLDLVDALTEINNLLVERRHRVAFRLLSDVVETIDLLEVLHAPPRAERALREWCKDRTISHGESRQHTEEVRGAEFASARRDYYKQLSKLTHRTYRALLKSFFLGRGDMLVPDTHRSNDLDSPQTLASGLAVLADLIMQALKCMSTYGPLTSDEITEAYRTALEPDTIARRFAPRYPPSKYA